MPDKQILLADPDTLILQSPYSAEEVHDTQRVPGARWDRVRRVWTFPMSSVAEVRLLAEKHDIWMDSTLASFKVPEHPVGQTRLELKDDHLRVYFPYDKVKITAIKQVPGATFDKQFWRIPHTSITELKEFVAAFGVETPEDQRDELRQLEERVTSQSRHLLELSAATSAELEVDINGQLMEFQKAGVVYASTVKRTFIADEMGLGKGGRPQDRILTPSGWTTYGTVDVGNRVIGSDGRPVTVTGVYPRGVLETFMVRFSDNTSVVVDGDHLWRVSHQGDGQIMTTRELAGSDIPWEIPLVSPVEFNPVELYDPYSAGRLLAEEHVTTPDIYLRGSPAQRMEFLEGVLDVGCEFSSRAQAAVVVELTQSLGGVALIEVRDGRWCVEVRLPDQVRPQHWPVTTPPARHIISVEPHGESEVICISVDAPDSLYVTESYIVTHNTVQAIATTHHNDAYPALVVCPPSLTLNWQREWNRFVPTATTHVVANRSEEPSAGLADVLIMGDSNIATYQKVLSGFKTVVIDESHRMKSFDTKRTKAAIKISKDAEFVLLLTGTPITNRPAEYASQLEILGYLNEFGGRWGFYKRYANAFQDRWGSWNILGSSNLEELNTRLRGTCYVRRRKKTVMGELAPVREEELWVDGSPSAMKEYRKAKDDIIEYVAQRAAQLAMEMGQPPNSAAVRARFRAEAAETLVRIAALRKLAAEAKMPAVYDWIDERIEAGLKVVVAAHHRDVVDMIATKYGAERIQGGMSVASVEVGKYKFQEGDAQVMVVNIEAGGTGHTLTAAQDLLMVEYPWTPAAVDQMIARLHRKGQEGSVLVTHMIANDTIDADMVRLLLKKRAVVEAATDGGTPTKSSSIQNAILNNLFRTATN